MDEELVKRNTDCVYFLASPLTCKKGIECEYRHSEIARLNPRDCWYWLAGNCLNPGCAFRHPPLVARNDASSDHAPQQYQYSVPVNKTSIPCYFHFNGFCNKGDRCSFLHELDDSTPGWKSMKAVSAVTNALPLENKTTEGIDTGSEPTEPHHNSCEIVHKGAAEISIKPKEDGHQLATYNISKSAYLHLSASEFEDAVAAESLFPPECIIQNRSLLCADQSSEEKLDGHIEGGKWLDSSPGFDVLVDDTFWNLGYEDDQEYLLAQDREGRELNSHVFGNDYEEQAVYDLDCPDSEIMYEVDAHDTYFDNEHTYSNGSKVPGRLKGRILDPMLPNKRNFLPMELFVDCWRGVDLRDHLNKSRMIDGRHMGHISRRHDSCRLIGGTGERSQRHCTQWLHGRLAKDADNSTIRSYCENEIPLKGANKRSKFRYSRIKMSRNHCKEKRQTEHYFLLSNISQKHASKRRRSTKGYAIFTGRNTLMKIKERTKSKENGDFSGKMGHSGRITSEDFQGPKPLSEILKKKWRLSSVIKGNN